MEIIGLAGGKGAGKDSAARLITGAILTNLGLTKSFDMTEDGELIIDFTNEKDGVLSRGTGIFDLDRRDPEFMECLYNQVWPHVKIYHFADSLKYILANMFGLDMDMLFGDQKAKESLSPITWEKMVDVIPKKKLKKGIVLSQQMTYREVMQHFGDICRNIDDMCFVRNCMEQIYTEQSPVSIIADVRRPEELEAINNAGGKVIYLKRTSGPDTHEIESALVNVDPQKFFLIVENQNMGIGQKNIYIINELKNRGFLS